MNRRIKLEFDARGIEIPYPHQTIYFGEDKDGRAPPAYVRMLDKAAPPTPPTPPKPPEPPEPPRREKASEKREKLDPAVDGDD
jgi:small conductance mechanosensitive channel